MKIPIIGNGDITTPERAKECFDRYGVDAIMIGRGSFGRPWIFEEVKHYLQTGEKWQDPGFQWKMNVLKQETLDSIARLDERRGIVHIRRHLAASPLFQTDCRLWTVDGKTEYHPYLLLSRKYLHGRHHDSHHR